MKGKLIRISVLFAFGFLVAQLRAQKTFLEEEFASVQDYVRTNVLETWEGQYATSAVYPLFSPRVQDGLFLCVYTCPQAEGNLAELYRVANQTKVLRVLAADVNVKGVTPRLEALGCLTNSPVENYWIRWRHPGNGGYLTYDEYACVAGKFSLTNRFEYCDIGEGKRWYLVDSDENYHVTTNYSREGSLVLWTQGEVK